MKNLQSALSVISNTELTRILATVPAFSHDVEDRKNIEFTHEFAGYFIGSNFIVTRNVYEASRSSYMLAGRVENETINQSSFEFQFLSTEMWDDYGQIEITPFQMEMIEEIIKTQITL